MGGGGAMDDDDYGHNDNLAEANDAEFGDDAHALILAPMAEGVASSASDADEALALCRDVAAAEELDDDDLGRLIGMVEARTGWDLPREGGAV